MRLTVALVALALAGCVTPPPPMPQPVVPAYNEVAWDSYCRNLRAQGQYDTPTGDCRRLYEYQVFRGQQYQAQQQAHDDGVTRAQNQRRAIRNMGDALSGQPHTTCTSYTSPYGEVTTDCR